MPTRTNIARRNAGFTIGVGTAVDGVGYHAVDGSVAGSAPDDVGVVAFRGQIQPMFMEPQEGLSHAAEFFHLVENKRDRLLNAPVRVLLEPVACLYEADRRSDNELSAPCLLVSC